MFIPTEKIPEQDPICNKWVMRVAPSGTEGGFITAHGLADKALGKFPFGQDGDRLWVKETFLPNQMSMTVVEVDYIIEQMQITTLSGNVLLVCLVNFQELRLR